VAVACLGHLRCAPTSQPANNREIISVSGGRIVPVLMRLTRSIPMVLPGASDPVGVGWAQSLARPGGNVTGFTDFELSTLGKSLEILKQIAPAVVRVALIYNPDNPNSVHYRRSPRERPLGLPSKRSITPSMALATSIVPSRALPIVATAAFSSCPTSRPTRCATTSLLSSRGAACRRSIRTLSS
jgi:ABC transporter substrate binding protein